MYLLGILILIVSLFALTLLSVGTGTFFFSLSSLFFVIVIVIPMLYASGLFRYFLLAFKIASSKDNSFSHNQLSKSLISVNLAVKLLTVSGLIGFLYAAVALLARLDDLSKLGPYIAVMLLTNLYALFGIAFLLPVKARIKAHMADSDCCGQE